MRNEGKHTKAVQAEARKGTAASRTHDGMGASDAALIQSPMS